MIIGILMKKYGVKSSSLSKINKIIFTMQIESLFTNEIRVLFKLLFYLKIHRVRKINAKL